MKLFPAHIHRSSVRAFTLLEVLASFSIVTLVILGPLTFSINSASYSRQSKDVIVSEYLAQEALELLHHQYDTLYIACANIVDACDGSVPTNSGENSGAKAWRLFKERLHDTTGGSTSCFDAQGCAFDFLDMSLATTITPPKKYSPVDTDCPRLSVVNAAVLPFDPTIRNYYVCSGIDQADEGGRLKDNHYSVKKSAYSRVINVTSVPTFTEALPPSAPANLGLYQDDLIITASVSFRRSNGVLRTIKVTDFFHPRS